MPVSSLVTAAGVWLWDKYGKTVTDKAAGAVKDKWSEFKWKDASDAYRAKIKKLYGTMQIMGMTEPVPLDDIFTDAYMLDKPTAFGRFDIERLKQLSADPDAPPPRAERINGLRLVKEKGNLFILGKPGAGKTTFLKYIALQAAERNIYKVPIFVILKNWADSGLDLMPFIAERFEICDFPDAQPFVEELLKSGSAIVLFDGLDEVNQRSGQRDRQTRAMNNFVEKYDRTQCLITCRIAADDYLFQSSTYVEIADFTERQIQTFVGNWFRNEEGEKDEETSRKFLTEFAKADNKGLRDLAHTPLLLTLLCLAFNETLTFPQRRVEIYKEAVGALLRKWDTRRGIKRDDVYRKLSLGHKENMLAHIAAETFKKNEYFIPQSELERLITDYVRNVPPHDPNEAINGESILKAIEAQHGIFVERAREVYSFSHLSIQEYFTAKYIVASETTGTLTHLIREHCADGRWREVLLLTTSLLPDARQFMHIFRGAVDELLEGDKKLWALLAWAVKKTNAIETAPWLARASYLFVESDSEKTGYERALDHARALAHVPDLARALELEHDLARALEIDIPLARAPAHTLEHARTHADVIERDLERDLGRARRLALDSGLNSLARELAALSLPTNKATAAEWQDFADELRALMRRHRDIGHAWDLTEMQAKRLADYLNATSLLQDCLELAFMPPDEKEMMQNSLYLPPAQADDRQDA